MHCGSAVRDARSIPGERRQLTVVFCDLVGSTELSNRLEIEHLREFVLGYQNICVKSIEHMGGYVAQYLGDGILAYFGYPAAAEDDVERALRSALDAQEALQRTPLTRLGPRPSVRIGVHTGPVIVSELGSGARRENLALGATSNVAARLQALAAPGTVVASGQTLAHVPGLFVTSGLGRHTLKGIDEPVQVHRIDRVAGVRHRLDGAVLTPLVGRTREMENLRERWTQTLDANGQFVVVSGDAGLGKSRLVRAFRDSLSDTPLTLLDGYCAARASSSVFDPIITMLGRGLGFAEQDTPSQRLTRLEQALAVHGADAARTVPPLARLLSVPPSQRYAYEDASPEIERERTLSAAVSLVLALAQPRPLLFTIEDLHWSDPSTLEFLQRLTRQLAGARVMIVATARTTLDHALITADSTLTLAPLSADEIRSLAVASAPNADLPVAVLDQIVARADGVPLFAEELSRTVDTSRSDTTDDDRLTVPVTLQDSLMARLDRLGEAKRVAQLCATLGRQFGFDLIEAASDAPPETLVAALERLVDAGILLQQGTSPRGVYTFKHALLQDIAYHSQLDSEREKIHARIARILEMQLGETTPEAVAEHYREGGLGREAARYYLRAGDNAFERWANAEAIEFYRRAVVLEQEIDAPAQRRLQTRLRLADALARSGHRLEAASTYLHGVGIDPAFDFELRQGAGYNFLRAERVADGLRELEALCREAGLGWPRTMTASFVTVVALRIKVALSRYRFDLAAQSTMAPSAARLMDLCRDLAVALRLLAPFHAVIFASRFTLLALRSGDPDRVARALALEAGTQSVAGSQRGPTADSLITQAEGLAHQVGDPVLLAFVRVQAASVTVQAGEWGRTRALCEEAEAILRVSGAAEAELDVLRSHLTVALYFLGDLPALARLGETQRESSPAGATLHWLDVGHGATTAMLFSDDPEQARQRAAAARVGLKTGRFGLPDVLATQIEVESLLYEGRGRDAARLMRERWPQIKATFILSSQLAAVNMWELAGRSELAAVVDGDARAVAGTRRAIGKLRRTKCAWGDALAVLLTAGLEAATGDRDGARSLLAQAVDQLEAAELRTFADAARHRLLQLTPNSRAGMADLETSWASRGVASPTRLFTMMAPATTPDAGAIP